MILHSHNSWSYLPIWKGRLFKWFARCQSKDIIDQYADGVKGFDLRVRFKGSHPSIVHGKVVYFCPELFKLLNFLDIYQDSYVRVVLDIRKEKDFTASEKYRFIEFCQDIELLYPNITFYCGEVLYDHHKVYDFKTQVPEIIEEYSSVKKCSLMEKLIPWLYAKRHNKEILEKYKDTDKHIMIDFI